MRITIDTELQLVTLAPGQELNIGELVEFIHDVLGLKPHDWKVQAEYTGNPYPGLQWTSSDTEPKPPFYPGDTTTSTT